MTGEEFFMGVDFWDCIDLDQTPEENARWLVKAGEEDGLIVTEAVLRSYIYDRALAYSGRNADIQDWCDRVLGEEDE